MDLGNLRQKDRLRKLAEVCLAADLRLRKLAAGGTAKDLFELRLNLRRRKGESKEFFFISRLNIYSTMPSLYEDCGIKHKNVFYMASSINI